MPFDSKAYGSRVAQILALRQDGKALMPLVSGNGSSKAGAAERAALEIQRAEWQLLFDYCARAGS